MPRYHFHVQLGDRFIPDREGIDLPNLKTVRGAEAQAAHASWDRVLCFIQSLPHRTTVITDEAGRIVFVLSL
ncbi:hypothetical protein [Microvirga sp. VF16]|uniref:DUF6894 family protein n=1 Tax=Microvirga sp. VF16 TaxID=2807101 RepID=UPI00193C98F5|nr:hypothetical protein [Microvirga sp. VF16]QRM27793.1 hypothetical protein JO965_16165 [Microvirga sp. VF16]